MEWRNIRGWPEYQVSDAGGIRRIKIGARGNKVCVLKPWISKIGYPMVTLSENGKAEKRYVHRLVCEMFHGLAPSSKHEVAHYDGTQINNLAENLRWVTRKENCDDSDRHGTRLRGERQNGAKLTAAQVLRIRTLVQKGVLQRDIAEIYDMSQQGVSHIVRRSTWRHLP